MTVRLTHRNKCLFIGFEYGNWNVGGEVVVVAAPYPCKRLR